MDTAFLATVLDRVRETQLQHGQTLAVIAKQQEMLMRNLDENRGRRSDRLTQWITLLRPIGYGVALWGAALATVAHMANGGDLITLLQMFVRLML